MDNMPERVTLLQDGLIRIIAPNPSPMTFWGTNTYLLGTGRKRVLIDPGPDSAEHRAAILNALPQGTEICAILVTHSHLDHSEGGPALARATGATTYAFGPSDSGRTPLMTRLIAEGLRDGGEGRDEAFSPDVLLREGQIFASPAGEIFAHHTPGHMSNHLCFSWQKVVFSGDLIMGWSTSLISPPDGDVTAFMESLTKIEQLRPTTLFPGHGASIPTPQLRIAFLRQHRVERESQILSALGQAPMDLLTLTKTVYHDLPPAYLPLAARNTFAHLIDLTMKNKASASPFLSENALFTRQ